MAGRLPDYRLAAYHKETEEKNTVGGAWINEDGRISIRLDAFIVLHGGKDLVLTLFKNDGKPRQQPAPKPNTDEVDPDDIPF